MKTNKLNYSSSLKALAMAGAFVMSALQLSAKQELNLYIWTEYLEPELIKTFEEKYDCKVIESNYESNEEMLAKLQAGGSSQYDIVFPSDFIVPSMIKLGLLAELDQSKIPEIKNLSAQFKAPSFDPENKYSAAYQWGTVGLVYSKSTFQEPLTSWEVLFKGDDSVNFSLFDSEREMIGVALAYLGHPINSTDKNHLKAAADLMIEAKKRQGFKGFDANVSGIGKIKGKTLDVSVSYSGNAFAAMAEDENLGYAIPKEGSVVWCDSMCIPKDAPNKELAHKFIDYILTAKVGAQLSNFTMFATPNEASLPMIDEAIRKNTSVYPDEEISKKLEFIQDAGPNTALFGEVWRMVKTR
jgi:spermidine/putrescine transport system substrate-binding protein